MSYMSEGHIDAHNRFMDQRPVCQWHKGAPLSQDKDGRWECYLCEMAISDFIDNQIDAARESRSTGVGR